MVRWLTRVLKFGKDSYEPFSIEMGMPMERALAPSSLWLTYGDMARFGPENLDGVLWFVKTLLGLMSDNPYHMCCNAFKIKIIIT